MSEISKEAREEASVIWAALGVALRGLEGASSASGQMQQMFGTAKAIIAAALQRHLDATARGEARAEARAEEKEALAWDRDQLLERVQELEAAIEVAKQDAEQAITTSVAWMKIAEGWRHKCQAAESALAELLRDLRWAAAHVDVNDLRARMHTLVDAYEVEP